MINFPGSTTTIESKWWWLCMKYGLTYHCEWVCWWLLLKCQKMCWKTSHFRRPTELNSAKGLLLFCLQQQPTLFAIRTITPRANVGLDVQASVIGGTESVTVPHNNETWRSFFSQLRFCPVFSESSKIDFVPRKFQSQFEITFKRLSNWM